MQVTYLGHSGFLVETEAAYYLFDYIRGTLPEFAADKSLYVFASHSHGDHFNELIFEEKITENATAYYLSRDIRKNYRRKSPEWMEQYQGKIHWIMERETMTDDGFIVEGLHSTDIGVAFVIREESGRNIYHAGDLNWWHWEGEPDPWNPDMEKSYTREINRLKGMHFDVAFVPLDPRLEHAYWYGLDYFLKKVQADHVFPMHFWEDYNVIPKYLKEHPLEDGTHTIIHLISQEDEKYEI